MDFIIEKVWHSKRAQSNDRILMDLPIQMYIVNVSAKAKTIWRRGPRLKVISDRLESYLRLLVYKPRTTTAPNINKGKRGIKDHD